MISEPKVGKSGISLGHKVTREPVNVSERSHGLCVCLESGTRGLENVFLEITWVVRDLRVGADV